MVYRIFKNLGHEELSNLGKMSTRFRKIVMESTKLSSKLHLVINPENLKEITSRVQRGYESVEIINITVGSNFLTNLGPNLRKISLVNCKSKMRDLLALLHMSPNLEVFSIKEHTLLKFESIPPKANSKINEYFHRFSCTAYKLNQEPHIVNCHGKKYSRYDCSNTCRPVDIHVVPPLFTKLKELTICPKDDLIYEIFKHVQGLQKINISKFDKELISRQLLLEDLCFDLYDDQIEDFIDDKASKNHIRTKLSVTIVHNGTFFYMKKFIKLHAHNLKYLRVKYTSPNFDDLQDILSILPNLEHLDVHLVDSMAETSSRPFRRSLEIFSPNLKIIEMTNVQEKVVEKLQLHGKNDIIIILRNVYDPAHSQKIFLQKNPGFPPNNICFETSQVSN